MGFNSTSRNAYEQSFIHTELIKIEKNILTCQLDQKNYKNIKHGLIPPQGMLMNNLQFILNQEILEQDLQKQIHMTWRFTRLIKT